MEVINLKKEIPVLCVTAASFPEGIADAHQRLHTLVALSPERRYFGISHPEDGNIVYKAAAEALSDSEATELGCERFVIRAGQYMSIYIKDYNQNIESIGDAFKKLLALPNLDPQGYCLEWYTDDVNVACMVPLVK